MNGPFDGGCFCGKLRYRLHGWPMFTYCCHCTECRRQTGSAFVINAQIESDRVEVLSGEPIAVPVPTESGYPHDIYRCETCQTAVWSNYGRRSWLLFIKVATLDDPAAFRPEAHIYLRSRLPWLALDASIPGFDEYYDMERLWKRDSFARREAARIKAGASR